MRDFADELKKALIARRLPRAYVERSAEELNDHYQHLIEENLEQGLIPREAEEAALADLGTVDVLAAEMADTYRARRTFWQKTLDAIGDGPTSVLRILGTLTMLLAGFGLWSTYGLFHHVMGRPPTRTDQPYFMEAYFVMLGIAVTLLLLLAWGGLQIFLRRSTVLQLFCVTCLLMVVFAVGTGGLWLNPVYGRSIAAATGVASGGLALFELTLFPLWAPFVVAWGLRRTTRGRLKVAEG